MLAGMVNFSLAAKKSVGVGDFEGDGELVADGGGGVGGGGGGGGGE